MNRLMSPEVSGETQRLKRGGRRIWNGTYIPHQQLPTRCSCARGKKTPRWGAREDCVTAYAELEKRGLTRVHKNSSNGETVIPTTSTLGKYTGTSAADVRDHVRSRISDAFKARRLKAEIFVVVGENGTWGATTTWSSGLGAARFGGFLLAWCKSLRCLWGRTSTRMTDSSGG